MWAWGANFYGQHGNGKTGSLVLNPVRVFDESGAPSGVVSLSVGISRLIAAIKSDGTVWTGWNGMSANPLDGLEVVKDASGSPISGDVALAVGGSHTVALKGDGTVLAWGYNWGGQLGDGTTSDRLNPVVVQDASGTPLSGVVAIKAGVSHTVALKGDGTVLASE